MGRGEKYYPTIVGSMVLFTGMSWMPLMLPEKMRVAAGTPTHENQDRSPPAGPRAGAVDRERGVVSRTRRGNGLVVGAMINNIRGGNNA